VINNAMAYAEWRQQLLTTPTDATLAAGPVMVERAIIDLLASDQFYGELLTRLPRHLSRQLTVPFALTWRANRLELTMAAVPLAQTFTRFDELQAGLKHVALHVLWQHPLRYRQRVARQPELVTLATDLAVNQYVTGLPKHSTGLATVQPLVAAALPVKADSSVYLKLLQSSAQRQASSQSTSQSPQTAGDAGTSTGTQPLPAPIDAVAGWQATTGQLTNPNLAASRLQQLVRDAWTHTREAGRGLVAGQVRVQLAIKHHAAVIDWRRLLVKGLGQLPTGKQASYARFNRRQPARMELPGQISDTQLQVQVYVDHSGSISDATLQYLLSQVATLTRAMTATITVSPFDAVVRPGQTYQADLPQQIRYTRQGGGGTVYQSIFDDLRRQHATNQTTLAVVLTDGRGEREIDAHHFTNVIWVLAHPHDRLSIQPVIGQVVTLKKGADSDDTTT